MSNQELIDDYNKWRVASGLKPMSEHNTQVLLKKPPSKCVEAIEELKKKAIEKLSSSDEDLKAPSPDEDLKAALDFLATLLFRVEAQEVKLAEQSTKLAEQSTKLAEQEKRIAQLESAPRPASAKKKTPDAETRSAVKGANAPLTEPVEGKCQHLFTKGCNVKGTYCGVRIANSNGSEREKKYCKFHYDKVAVLLKEAPSLLGKGEVVAKERSDEWWADRCKHTKGEGVLKGHRCQRLAKGNGFCTIHGNTKKRRVEESVEESESESVEESESESKEESKEESECVARGQECICE